MRMLPWVHALRRKNRRYGLVCDGCQLDDETKRRYRCGWIDRAEWVPDKHWRKLPAPGDCKVVLDQCPGYLLALPQVTQAAELWMHWDKGQLPVRCGDWPVPPIALDLVVQFNAEHGAAQSWEMDSKESS